MTKQQQRLTHLWREQTPIPTQPRSTLNIEFATTRHREREKDKIKRRRPGARRTRRPEEVGTQQKPTRHHRRGNGKQTSCGQRAMHVYQEKTPTAPPSLSSWKHAAIVFYLHTFPFCSSPGTSTGTGVRARVGGAQEEHPPLPSDVRAKTTSTATLDAADIHVHSPFFCRQQLIYPVSKRPGFTWALHFFHHGRRRANQHQTIKRQGSAYPIAAQNQGVPRADHPVPTSSLTRHLATIRSTVRKHAAGQMASNHRDSPVISYGVFPPRGAAVPCCGTKKRTNEAKTHGQTFQAK